MRGNESMGGTYRRSKRNKRKKNQLLGILACLAGLLLVAGVIFLITNKMMKGSFLAKAGETDYVAYDFGDVVLDEYEAPLGGTGSSGTVTRYRVSVVATPGEAGTVTGSQYVTAGGSTTVEVTSLNGGYEFDGWYIDGVRVSRDKRYNIVGVKSDVTVIAKFSVDMIDITTNVIAIADGISFNGGGVVLGGGSLYKNSGNSLYITAKPAAGYEFECFIVGEKSFCKGATNPKLEVREGNPPSGKTDIAFVSKDTVVTARFIKSENKRLVTATIVPAAGDLSFDNDVNSPKAPYISKLIDNSNPGDYINIAWSVPETSVPVTGGDGKPDYKRRYEMDYILVKQNGTTFDSERIDYLRLEDTYKLNAFQSYPLTGDFDIFVVLKAQLAQDQGTFCASTVSVPSEGGVTTGGGSSTLTSTYNLKATPNAGWKFDHWEWCENGVYNSSEKPDILVTPSGYISYKAFFVPAYYNISLASSDPADGGAIIGLGNINTKPGEAGATSTTLTVKPASGYKLDSGTYVMGGNSYIINFTFDDVKTEYNIPINNITDDVALNLKYKKDTIPKVTLWDDSREPSGNMVGFSDSDLKDDYDYRDVDLDSQVTILAQETADYKFKQWVSSNGNIIPASECTQSDGDGIYSTSVKVTGDVSYYAQFEPTTYTIKVLADPSTDGKVEIFDASTSKDTSDTAVPAGATRTLKATPKSEKHFLYWTNSAGTKMSGVTASDHTNTLTLTNINWLDTYTAHFVDDHLEVGVDVSDPDAGTAQLNDKAPVSIYTTYNDIPYEETIYLKAVPNQGYRFVRWDIITYDGLKQESRVSYADPAISLVYVAQDVDCVAVFEKGDYTIKVASAPVAGGKATANGLSDQAEVDEGAKVELAAAPGPGYTFDYWTDSAGNRYTDNPYTIDSVNGNDTFTAHFKSPQVSVTIQPSKDGAGTVQLDNNPTESTKKVYANIANGSNVSLKAVPANGCKFVRWEAYSESSNRTTAYGEANTVITDIREDTTFTAVFSDSSYTVKVISDPVSGGTTFVNGKLDSADFMPGEGATLEAVPASGYRFDYWTDSAGNKYTQNPYTLVSVNGNETYTAHYVNGKVQITVKNTPDEAAYLLFNGNKVSSGTAVEVESGENVIITAEDVNPQRYKFERWESSSGKIYTTNPLNLVNVTQSETYTAVYNSTEKARGITVISSPASGGKATKTVDKDGKNATLKAVANRGYYFASWSKNNSVFSNKSEVVVDDLSDGVVYKAIFVKDKNYDAKSDIISEHFYNDKRLFTNPNYSVTREKMTADAKARIEAEKAGQYKNSTPGLKQYKAVSDAAEIYDDIELKDDTSVVMIDSELITTNGEIMPLTLVADSSKEEAAAKEFTEKKYGKRYTYEIVACKDVGIPEGFEDGIRTYIWKYQDIHSKDNIYILYEGKDGKTDWVSCTIDAGDSLKFTIDSIGSGVRMTIVKVIIE